MDCRPQSQCYEGIFKVRQVLNLDNLPESEIFQFDHETDMYFSSFQDAKNCCFSQKQRTETTQAGSPVHQNLDFSEKSESPESHQNSLTQAQTPKDLLGKRTFDDLSLNFSNDDFLPLQTGENKQPKSASLCRLGPCTRSISGRAPKAIKNFKDISLMEEDSKNKMKNHPGTIAAKIKRLCQKNKETGHDTRLFRMATFNESAEKREEFREWTSKLDKRFKTWETLTKFLHSNSEFGILFVTMIHLFLSSKFQNEYEEWLDQGQMNNQTKRTLRDQDNKDFFITKFSLIIDDMFGIISDLPTEISKPRKFLKKHAQGIN